MGGSEEEFWRDHVLGWRRAEISRSAYCGEHGLNPRTFHRWVDHFRDDLLRPSGGRRRGRPRLTDGVDVGKDTSAGSGEVTFVPLVVAEDDGASGAVEAADAAEEAHAGAGQVDVLLADAVVRVRGSVDEALLRRVLTAVRATA